MDGRNYLNQISTLARPQKKSKLNFMKSPFFIVIAVGIFLTLLVIIISSLLDSGTTGPKNQGIALKLHIDNTLEVIDNYQSSVKSSSLRSSSASLASVLSNTSRDITGYLEDTYDYKNGSKNNQKIVDAALLAKDGLESALFEAKVTGVLDRVYAMKMAYEISLLINEETQLYNVSSDETLRDMLTKSYNSLNNLYDKFNDYSGAK